MSSRRRQRDKGEEFGATGPGARPIIGLNGIVTASMLLALSAPALGDDSRNRCRNPATGADWEKLLSTNPRDPVVIRLYGLHRGLCSMIDDGLVELDQAIEIFNQEHARSVVERYKEEQGRVLRF